MQLVDLEKKWKEREYGREWQAGRQSVQLVRSTHMGTAGAVLDCPPAPELDCRSSSSLSRMVFSEEIIRRDAIIPSLSGKYLVYGVWRMTDFG